MTEAMTDETKPTRGIATCRTCRRAFARDGFGRQCEADPKSCLDCFSRERAFGWQRMVDAQRGVAINDGAMDPRD